MFPLNSPYTTDSLNESEGAGALVYPGQGKIRVFLGHTLQFLAALGATCGLVAIPLIGAFQGSDGWWTTLPAVFIGIVVILQSFIRRRVSLNTYVDLTRDSVSIHEKGRPQREIPWDAVGQVEINAEKENVIFRDRKGELLGQTPAFRIPQGNLAALIATMKLRTGPDTLYFRVSEHASGKRKRRLNRGRSLILTAFPLMTAPFVPFYGPSAWAIALSVSFFGFALLAIGARDVFIAYSWNEMGGREKLCEYTFDNTLLPYAHWFLAGDPIPGDFSFQYTTNDLSRMGRKPLYHVIQVAGTILLFAVVAFLGIQAGEVSAILTVFGLLIGLVCVCAYLFYQQRRIDLVDHSMDEVVISNSAISVWHNGSYLPVRIAGAPHIRIDSRFKSELRLKHGDDEMLFDPLEMSVLK